MVINKRVTAPIMACLCVSIAVAEVAQAETLRLSSETSDSTSRNKGAERFAELVEKATDGEKKVKVFANAVLAGGDQLKQAEMVGRGDIDFLLSSAISVSPLIPEMSVFSLPYLYNNYDEVDATLNGEPAKEMEAIMSDQGLVVLGWGESGFRELTNSVHPVKTPADLSGLKIRVAGPMFIDILDDLGANPQQIQWTETFSALQQGVVDGQENPIGAVIIPQRIYEVQDYLTEWHYSYDPAFLAVSKKRWESWGEETQATMKQAAEEAMAYQKQLTREQTAEGVDLLKEKGMEIYSPSEEELQAFRNATQSAFDTWSQKVGEPLVETFQANIEQSRQSQ
ncbi:DctP family TRAP transporter solute-binding subunit [Vreelandella arcis]|uniref:Tripartite ATP-independent transporter solute receptor, DctP family n=1 Tax=Vreelandella arcis TaxID=416873 RepID=A0A1H0GZF0_9GAMM|nr:DctP family TRAP transporter solute-binding subunit [Halomonas arcis]SDO12297.1 tripartite ATP-independent transporter solute receptor, DctP family [Halomonas arcis]